MAKVRIIQVGICLCEVEVKLACDDEYFHQNVIPDKVCPKCGKKATDDYRPLATTFPDGMQV